MVDTFTRTRSTWTLHFTICLVTLVTENLEPIPKIYFSFASSSWKAVKVSWVARMGRHFDDNSGFQPKTTPAQRYATQCTYNSMTMQILKSQQVCEHISIYIFQVPQIVESFVWSLTELSTRSQYLWVKLSIAWQTLEEASMIMKSSKWFRHISTPKYIYIQPGFWLQDSLPRSSEL